MAITIKRCPEREARPIKQFVQRKAMNAYKADVAATFDGAGMRAQLDALLGQPEGLQAFELALAGATTPPPA